MFSFSCFLFVIVTAGLIISRSEAVSIETFGAVANVDTVETARLNAKALELAIYAANSSPHDRSVLVPRDQIFFMSAVHVSNCTDIQIRVEGIIRFTDIIAAWDRDTGSHSGMLWFTDCEDIELVGSGGHAPTTPCATGTDVYLSVIDGQGLKWWRMSYSGHEMRPRMVKFDACRGVHVHGVSLLNSPTYHLYLEDCADAVINNVYVFVDTYIARGPDGQKDSVTYPLNTDAFDLKARNVTVFNCNITSFDDAIVAKPCKSTGKLCQCAGDILAYNNSIYYSTGLTIGSVPPSPDVNCVRNVTFRDSTMFRPFKAVYVKTNPGNDGRGVIEDITYENIHIEQALWWTIWIGPQQQNQPNDGDSGTGCSFLYPFFGACPTQPRVTVRGVRLINVTATDTLPLFEGPGVLLCDAKNPCTDLIFGAVTNTPFPGDARDFFEALPFDVPQVLFPTHFRSDDWTFDYITEDAYGQCAPVGSCVPDPHLLPQKSW